MKMLPFMLSIACVVVASVDLAAGNYGWAIVGATLAIALIIIATGQET